LLDHNLLQRVEDPGNGPRVGMLETIREYARERLESSGERDTIRDAHAAAYLALAEAAEPELTGPDQRAWLDRLAAEHDNLREALSWATAHDASRAIRLVGALWRYWWVRGHLREGRAWAEAALSRDEGSPAERARAYHAAGDLAQEHGDYAGARSLLAAGRDLARVAGEPAIAALCLGGLGFIARNQGAYVEAEALHEEALTLQRALGDRRATACTLANLGSIAQNRGESARAEALFAEALATFRALGDQPLAADVSANLAILANQEGNHTRARRLAEEALDTYRVLGDRQASATALLALANATRGAGDRSHAWSLYEEALDLFRGVDHLQGTAGALTHLASLALDDEDAGGALPLLAESLRIVQRTGDRPAIAAALAATTRVAAALGRWEQVARLAAAVGALRAALGVPAPRAESEAQRELVSAATAALGSSTVVTAEAAGRALNPEQAVAEALALVEQRG
jgi:tetratricopeptide (TPR) repeat protein